MSRLKTSNLFGTIALRELSLGLFYLAVAEIVASSFMTMWGKHIAEILPKTLSFEMPRPFALRVASPWVLGKIIAASPYDKISAFLTKRFDEGEESRAVMDQALGRYMYSGDVAVEMLIVDLFFIVVLVATCYAWRGMLGSFALPKSVCLIGPGLFMLALPVHFAGGGYVYDFPEILLASLVSWAFIERRWIAFYPLLTLAVLNKESSVVLVVFLVVFLLDRDWRRTFLHGTLCVLFGLLPSFLVRLAFVDSPGDDVFTFFSENMAYFASLDPWLGRSKPFHPLAVFPASLNILSILMVFGFVFYRFATRPRQVKIMLGALIGVLFPVFLVMGWQNEVRVFGMCFPLMMVLAAHTLADLIGEGPTHTPYQQRESGTSLGDSNSKGVLGYLKR